MSALPVAIVLVVAVAGLTGRAWLLPVAVTLALPVLWLNSLAILAACVPLWREGAARRAAAASRPVRCRRWLRATPADGRTSDSRRLLDRLGRALAHPAVLPGLGHRRRRVRGHGGLVRRRRRDRLIGYDAHAYYQAAALEDPYRATINGGFDAVGGLYEFKYPPAAGAGAGAVADARRPVARVPGRVDVLLLVSLAWVGRRWTLLLLLFPPVLGELWLGNLNILLGARRGASGCDGRRPGHSSC